MKNRLETMMKIHTTQNLNSLSTNQSTSVSLKKKDRLKHSSHTHYESNELAAKSSLSFKGNSDVAKRIAKSGQVVLFSPASTSFDMFKDMYDRGNQFKNAVNKF